MTHILHTKLDWSDAKRGETKYGFIRNTTKSYTNTATNNTVICVNVMSEKNLTDSFDFFIDYHC